ncbi:DMT(drug/metabolite transporter) superfamily permease [Cylindrospermum stagnale PCC 7417]|uniref:DMT(Drug/metabolite transporter) superfamily permease n=1 Tax=Cylindrospermum stagnale PCC 7417 TaxID=56107 RepID=K9WRN1_9NOST|nr:DMT(drug/metabolite transporter) superfamily permease [Cylindrospermum stagnale PCC 7417]
MGRFEKRPDNPRVRGDLSRAAENALWAVVEDLENLQQTVLRSLQEDVKRLEGDKNRLADDIERLLVEKEKLQQARQITEQQVLIRQLAEVLAKHISSQLQSSLATLASQAIEGESYGRATLKSAEVKSDINENVGQMLDTLDDTVTITFNSLQQELKNYQSSLSQQLSRMYNQQQQGEAILAEFVNRLHEELEKTQEETPLQAATTPTVLQLIDPREKSFFEASTTRNGTEPISLIPKEFSNGETKSEPPLSFQSPQENTTEPISVLNPELSESTITSPLPGISAPQENTTEPISVLNPELSESTITSPLPGISAPQENTTEPISVLNPELPESTTTSPLPGISATQENTTEPISVLNPELPESTITSPLPGISATQENTTEPISVLNPELSESTTTSPLPGISATQSEIFEPISVLNPDLSESTITSPLPGISAPQSEIFEPISVLNPDLSEGTTTSPTPTASIPKPLPREKAREPISVLRPDLSTTSTATAKSASKQGATPRRRQSRSAPNWSPVQVGFLLVVLSTVVSSLYNVAVKAIFQTGSEIFGGLAPTVGNILLVLMLRLLVVVPLMLLLAPILHPPVWQDLQNLFDAKRRNANSDLAMTQRVLLLSIVSGCCLFLSQVLIYMAIGEVATGVAIALFFIYPSITALLSWFLFRDRPNLWGAGAIASIFCGELLVLGSSPNIGNSSLGSSTAIFSGIAFAVYVILTRLCSDKLHPVSFTLINFATMLLCSFICLLVPLPSSWSLAIDSSRLLELILSAFMLGVLTLCGYLFNNFGIRQLGASRSAIIGASVPVLTVIFAGLMIQESLDIVQVLGVLLVTFGAAAFSFEKMRNQVKPSSSPN